MQKTILAAAIVFMLLDDMVRENVLRSSENGNFTAVAILNNAGSIYSSSVSFHVAKPSKISIGMHMSGAGPSQATLGQNQVV